MKIGMCAPFDGVDRERSGEHAGLHLAFGLALEIALHRRELAVLAHRLRRVLVGAEDAAPRTAGTSVSSSENSASGHSVGTMSSTSGMLGREHHVRGAEQRVGTGGEHLDLDALVPDDRERDVGADAAPDPVALHDLDRLGPVEEVEIGDEPVGVRGDREHPLLQRTLEHRVVAALAAPVGGDLFVREHGAQRGAPVDRRLLEVREAVRVDDRGAGCARRVPAHGSPSGLASLDGGRVRPTRTRRSAPRSAGPGRRRRRTRS